MPVVSAPTRVDQNGQATTSFVDTVGTTTTTYTYQKQQDALTVTNQGNANLTVTAGGVTYTVGPGANRTVNVQMTSFTIVASSGIQAFLATSVSIVSDLVQLSRGTVDSLKSATLYSRAIEDIAARVPKYALSKARSQIAANSTLRVAFWGDSITEGYDQIDQADAYPQRIFEMLKQALPDITVVLGNFALGGRKISQAVNSTYVGINPETSTNAGFLRAAPWGDGTGSVTGKSWRDHVRDFNPDLVIFAFGMNDSGDDVPSDVDAIERNMLQTAFDLMESWTSNPSVVVVPVFLPTKDTTRYSQGQIKTNAVARATRRYGHERKKAVADVNRLYRILRDGLDEGSHFYETEKNFSDFRTPGFWEGNESWSLGGNTAQTSGIPNAYLRRKRSFYNGFVEMEVYFRGYGDNAYGQRIDFRYNPTLDEKLTYYFYPNSASGAADGRVVLFSDDFGVIATSSLINVQSSNWYLFRFEADGPNHKVYFNGLKILDTTTYKKLHEGEIKIAGISTFGVALYRNITIGFRIPASGAPLYTEDDLLGYYNNSNSGNGINHPSGLGHALFYLPAFYGVIKRLVD